MYGRRMITWIGVVLVFAACVDAAPPEHPLVVPNCRVVLIHRASLAGVRLGILKDVAVAEGDTVEGGQVIATLRDEVARQVLAVAQKEMSNTVELRLTKKTSELATLEYSKAVELNRTIPGGVSELDVKKLRLAAEKSLLQMEQADFLLQMAALKKNEAEVSLETYQIVAPFSGVVLEVHKRPGEALGAGDVVAEIANFDTMRVEGFIPVAYSGRVQKGAPVLVEVASSDSQRPHRFEGRVKYIAPIVNAVSQEVRVWVEVENRRDLLKDGLPATMSIPLSDKANGEVAVDRSSRGIIRN